MEIKKNRINYFTRLAKGLAIVGILEIFLVIYFLAEYNNLKLSFLFIICFVALFSFIRYECWYRYYITKVSLNDTIVKIEFLDRTKLKSINAKLEDLEIILDKAYALDSILKLMFIINGKRVLVQYQNNDWKKDDLMQLYKLLK